MKHAFLRSRARNACFIYKPNLKIWDDSCHWELVRLEQGHERNGKGLELLVEGFKGAFPEDFIPDKYREKVDHLIANVSPPRKLYLLTDLVQNIMRGVDAQPSARLRQTRKGPREMTQKRPGWSLIHQQSCS